MLETPKALCTKYFVLSENYKDDNNGQSAGNQISHAAARVGSSTTIRDQSYFILPPPSGLIKGLRDSLD